MLKKRFAILGAIPQEVMSLKNHMEMIQTHRHAGREFYCGQLHNIDTVLAFSGWGKVAASITASILIEKFQIDGLIFLGVAGAISEDLNIGDIVIGEKFYQHDLDPRPIFEKHTIPLLNLKFIHADKKLLDATETAAITTVDNLSQHISLELLSQFKIARPKIIKGCIATGDQFIHSIDKTLEIKNEMPQALAVEMEGAAVAQTCHAFNIPFVVVRIISDRADHNASIDFLSFIENITTPYANNLIENLYKHLI